MKLPESLRREEIIIEPSGDLTGCKMMGEEVTEVLEYAPGELYVKKYKRIKYVKPDNTGILIGELPQRPLEKAMAGEGLLSQILIDKYVDHLPLHRQMQRFERAGVKIPYATLTGWVSETCRLITPLYEALKKEVLKSNYLHADETPIRVLDRDKSGESHKGFYWVYQNSIERIVIFDYQEGRGREDRRRCSKISKAIFRPMATRCMITLTRAKTSGKYTAWLMRGASLPKHLTIVKTLQNMRSVKYKNFMRLKENAKKKGCCQMK